jgi:hypothetical protein
MKVALVVSPQASKHGKSENQLISDHLQDRGHTVVIGSSLNELNSMIDCQVGIVRIPDRVSISSPEDDLIAALESQGVRFEVSSSQRRVTQCKRTTQILFDRAKIRQPLWQLTTSEKMPPWDLPLIVKPRVGG